MNQHSYLGVSSRIHCSFAKKPLYICTWQEELSNANVMEKVAMLKWSQRSDILEAQANLL